MDDFFTTIGQVADIFDGPHATPVKTDAGPYFLSISSLDKGRLDLSKSAHLSEDDFKKWTKRVTPKKGDLLFSYETRLGEAALMPDGVTACLGRRMGLLRPHSSKVTSEYLLYAYLSPAFQQTIVANTVTGATVDRIALNEMSAFPIRIPTIEEQNKVAGLLKNIDSKIECNNQINSKIESVIKSLYNYWFVQFDFPDSNGKPYRSSGGKMVYNATLSREIPDGWECCVLENHISFRRGISYKSTDMKDSGVPFINLNSFTLNGTFKPEGTKFFNGKYKNDALLNEGDLVIAITDVTRNADIIGKAFVLGDFFQQKPLMSCDVASASSETFGNFYLEQLFNSPNYHAYIRHFASGTLVLHLDLNGINWYETILPKADVLKEFEMICSVLSQHRHISLKENMHLNSLRDWLLPMLMNGQVNVS